MKGELGEKGVGEGPCEEKRALRTNEIGCRQYNPRFEREVI